jgi:hypothetical protein
MRDATRWKKEKQSILSVRSVRDYDEKIVKKVGTSVTMRRANSSRFIVIPRPLPKPLLTNKNCREGDESRRNINFNLSLPFPGMKNGFFEIQTAPKDHLHWQSLRRFRNQKRK